VRRLPSATPASPSSTRFHDRRLHSLRFLHVLACVVQQPDHMMIVERVVGQPSLATHTHEPGRTKQPKLVRHRRLGHSNEVGKIPDAAFSVGKRVEETNAGRISEKPENLGDGFHGLVSQQPEPR